MPTYDYRCPNGHDSEHFFRKISDAPSEVPCPLCGAEAVRRVSGGAGLLFKGSGFYLTDYGKNAHRKPAADASKSDGKPDTKTDGKAETPKSESGATGGSDAASKPAAKSDTSKAGESKASSTKSKSGDSQ
jgi:putative FmdB family regulatory protein